MSPRARRGLELTHSLHPGPATSTAGSRSHSEGFCCEKGPGTKGFPLRWRLACRGQPQPAGRSHGLCLSAPLPPLGGVEGLVPQRMSCDPPQACMNSVGTLTDDWAPGKWWNRKAGPYRKQGLGQWEWGGHPWRGTRQEPKVQGVEMPVGSRRHVTGSLSFFRMQCCPPSDSSPVEPCFLLWPALGKPCTHS